MKCNKHLLYGTLIMIFAQMIKKNDIVKGNAINTYYDTLKV